ncbi:MAG: antitoxin [Chloroflexota bacterium]|nr:MAG: antitoxin [Chloroflexota bacterium]
MNERDETRLRDMLDAARQAQSFIAGKTRPDLEANQFLIGFAVVRALTIIGEAAGKVSLETRAQLPQIAWKDIVGMRNRIIHDYNRVNYDVVWSTVVEAIPELIAQLEAALPPETDDSLPE